METKLQFRNVYALQAVGPPPCHPLLACLVVSNRTQGMNM